MTTSAFFISAWDWKPSVILGCVALVLFHAWASRWQFSKRSAAWLAGVVLIFFSLVSPLDALGDRYLFSAHMLKHILFVLIIPALLLIGMPARPLERILRVPSVSALENFLSTPAVAWSAGVGAMIVWHVPALFNFALQHQALHIVEHLTLLICGTVYWWPILSPLPSRRLSPVPQAAAYLFTSCVVCTALGIAITFAPAPLYPAFSQPSDAGGVLPLIRQTWGISPSLDQQIGGILMWVPGCLIYLSAIMAMFARWYGEEKEAPVRA